MLAFPQVRHVQAFTFSSFVLDKPSVLNLAAVPTWCPSKPSVPPKPVVLPKLAVLFTLVVG